MQSASRPIMSMRNFYPSSIKKNVSFTIETYWNMEMGWIRTKWDEVGRSGTKWDGVGSKVMKFLNRQNRYAQLVRSSPAVAEKLQGELQAPSITEVQWKDAEDVVKFCRSLVLYFEITACRQLFLSECTCYLSVPCLAGLSETAPQCIEGKGSSRAFQGSDFPQGRPVELPTKNIFTESSHEIWCT